VILIADQQGWLQLAKPLEPLLGLLQKGVFTR